MLSLFVGAMYNNYDSRMGETAKSARTRQRWRHHMSRDVDRLLGVVPEGMVGSGDIAHLLSILSPQPTCLPSAYRRQLWKVRWRGLSPDRPGKSSWDRSTRPNPLAALRRLQRHQLQGCSECLADRDHGATWMDGKAEI